MRERRVIVVAILLTVLVSVSLVFGLGVVDMSKLASPPVKPASPGLTTVFVDPATIIDETKQSGAIEISINISDVTDLYAYQVNITWNPNAYGEDILNFSRIVSYGDFLSQTTSPDGTSSIYDIFDASNDTGYAVIAESILGDVSGIPGPDGGELVTIEFKVVGYGYTNLTISAGGILPTTLLDSYGDSIIPDANTDGLFDNRLGGDANSDRSANWDDFIILAGCYGTSRGDPTFDERTDFNHDDDINWDDFIILAGNYGTSI